MALSGINSAVSVGSLLAATGPATRATGAEFSAPETFTTKADASTWLANTQTDLLRGTWVDPAAGKVTLVEYANNWLAKRSDLRPTTRAKHEGLLRRHILPALGGTELAKLRPSEVRAWYHSLARVHQATASDAYRTLRAVVNTAVVDGDLVKSPCTVRGAGSVKAAERLVASVAEVTAAVQAAPERYRSAFLLASWCQRGRGRKPSDGSQS
jgi:RNase P/RNase MRP subunit POP5